MTSHEKKLLMDFKATLGERYINYLLIVQPEHGDPVAVGNDVDFSVAASKAFVEQMNEVLED